MYHGGFIRNNSYIGGKFDYYDMVDKDKMSLIEIDGMVKGLSQTYAGSRIDYWYAIGSEDDALTKMTTDFDVSTMCCCVPEFRLVIIYLDHLDLHYDFSIDSDVYEDEISNCVFSQVGSNGVVIEELPDEPRKKPLVVIKEFSDETKKKVSEIPDKLLKIVPAIPTKKAIGVVIRDKEVIPTQLSITPDHDPKDKGKQKVEQDTGFKLEEFFDNELVDINVSNYLSRGRYKQYYEETCEDSSDKSNSDDEDYTPVFDGDDYDQYGVDDDWLDDMDGEFNEAGEWIGADTGASIVASFFVDEDMQVEDNEEMFGAVDSDEEAIGHEANSDDEGGTNDFPEFNPKTDMKNPQFSKGLKFSTAKILRAAIRERAIQDGWEAVFIKSDKTRVRVICKADDCPFELFASKMQHEGHSYGEDLCR
ncbi:hypothetical protein M0R45_026636 [Rubus argutus]|uniref:Transposase MuDR plant domain-containing protein n=1 Tax=Rubus argutus TaxID=59490 RepID=A0AAW1WZY3_RUBAR